MKMFLKSYLFLGVELSLIGLGLVANMPIVLFLGLGSLIISTLFAWQRLRL